MLGDEGFLHLFAAKRRDAPEGIFARFNGAPITFAALGRMADGVAAALRRRGIARGERVAVMMRNSPATLGTIFGLAQAGVIWVPVNVQQRGPGLKYILEHCDPRLIIADADLVATISDSAAALPDMAIVTSAIPRPPTGSKRCWRARRPSTSRRPVPPTVSPSATPRARPAIPRA